MVKYKNNKLGDIYLRLDRHIEIIKDPIFGKFCYYYDNLIHREDGPAILYLNGDKAWFRYGEIHREDGPAIEYASGEKQWWFQGQLHRSNGPALIDKKRNYTAWYYFGLRHREDGPAVQHHNGDKEFWIQNKKYSEAEYWRMVKLKSLW
jgi:hypothetical protein